MSEPITPPKTYLERERLLPNAEFMLISYAHASAATVYPDLERLFGEGLNFWYDRELLGGDVWHEVVKERLSDERCAGIIFFFDVNCLLGGAADGEMTGKSAIEREIRLFEEISRDRPSMRAFCVLAAEDASVYAIVRQAFLRCADLSADRLREVLPEERIITVLRAFNADKLYFLRQGDYIREIVAAVAKASPLAVSDSRAAEGEFGEAFGSSLRRVNGNPEITLGSYPASYGPVVTGALEGEITEVRSERVMTRSRRQFLFEPLSWLLLETDGREATLLSRRMLDVTLGSEGAVTAFLDRFPEIAFSPEEREAITAVSLPSEAVCETFAARLPGLEATDLCDHVFGDGGQCYAWLSDTGGGTRSTLCAVRDGAPDIDYDFLDAHYGILPMIKVNLETIRRIHHG